MLLGARSRHVHSRLHQLFLQVVSSCSAGHRSWPTQCGVHQQDCLTSCVYRGPYPLAWSPADIFPVLLQVVSSALLGATAGSITGSSLADKRGRKKSFLIACLPLVLGSFLCASATSAQSMLAGRFFAGVGIGLSSALVPLYISEVCNC